jgi:hypothetical protein
MVVIPAEVCCVEDLPRNILHLTRRLPGSLGGQPELFEAVLAL